MFMGDYKEKMAKIQKKRREIRNRVSFQMRELRESLGFNTVEMARYFNISDSSWHRYESGARVPSVTVLQKLLDEHDISIDWLFFNHGPQKASEKGGGEKVELLEQRIRDLERQLEEGRKEAAASQPTEKETRAMQFLKKYEDEVGPFPDPRQFKPDMLHVLEGISTNRIAYLQVMLAFEQAKEKTG